MKKTYSVLLKTIETICNDNLDEQTIRNNVIFYNKVMRELKDMSHETKYFYNELASKSYVRDYTLQNRFLFIESVIEKVSAEQFLEQGVDAVFEEKIKRHTPLMEKDGADLALTKNNKVILIGSGSIPITGIILNKKFGCKIVCVDLDIDAITLSRKVISTLGLDSNFQFICNDIKNIEPENISNSTAVITAFVQNKDQIIKGFFNKCNNLNLLIRQPRGPYSLIYDKVDINLLNKLESIQIDDDLKRGHYCSVIGRIR